MSKQDNMTFKTYSGIIIDPDNIKISDFELVDIARGLSNICRFSGQIPVFYSVAQHSIRVFNNLFYAIEAAKKGYITYLDEYKALSLPNIEVWETPTKKAALLHDASEAYLSDFATPWKSKCLDYQNLEDKIMRLIFKRFNIEWQNVNWDLIKEFDQEAYNYEREYLNAFNSIKCSPDEMFSKFLQLGLEVLK